MSSLRILLMLFCSATFASNEERIALQSGAWELIGTWRAPVAGSGKYGNHAFGSFQNAVFHRGRNPP